MGDKEIRKGALQDDNPDALIGLEFSLFMIKAVLNGRGDELIDLAKVNLFR